MIQLSICIATFKRADFIAETLESIVPQLSAEVELVVLDGASPDDTADVVARFTARSPYVRYIREDVNSGIDADFDKVVQHARGKHCWLFSDDDTIVPGAVATVLAELAASDPDLIVVDAEVRDKDLTTVFEPRRLRFSGRRTYRAADSDALLADLGDALSFIGCVIVRRSLWLTRERQRYYGTLFIHVGVLLQAPLACAVALGEPLVRIRIGNAMWTTRGFQIWMFLWPELIWSFPGFSAAAKARVVLREPWRQPQKLLVWRAYGVYTADEFDTRLAARVGNTEGRWMRMLARLPGRLAHVAVVALLTARGHGGASSVYQLVEGSRFSTQLSRAVARLGGFGRGTPTDG
ncbi:glycosyltransferase [Sphingomonas sp. CD22]|uniref:glycosyltransferase family 2 protein n=1 Tax=Sphingomonas sp. CD22 TaxID=3100214 RepID=UPI002ADF0272|nr:glycosyltransferase [Sphingomonas sp. CD22]MEA1085867.1 glycosyltransferase [Sphingomonas sp. CD22]